MVRLGCRGWLVWGLSGSNLCFLGDLMLILLSVLKIHHIAFPFFYFRDRLLRGETYPAEVPLYHGVRYSRWKQLIVGCHFEYSMRCDEQFEHNRVIPKFHLRAAAGIVSDCSRVSMGHSEKLFGHKLSVILIIANSFGDF